MRLIRLRKLLTTLWLNSFITTALSCTVVIKDQEWCADKGDLGAKCFHTLTTESRDLAKPVWDAERFGQVCTVAPNFADIKAWTEKLCRETQNCVYPKQLHAFFEIVRLHDEESKAFIARNQNGEMKQ